MSLFIFFFTKIPEVEKFGTFPAFQETKALINNKVKTGSRIVTTDFRPKCQI